MPSFTLRKTAYRGPKGNLSEGERPVAATRLIKNDDKQ